MKDYKVLKCNNCNKNNITSGKERFRCLKCNKINIIINRKPIFNSINALAARKFIIEYEREQRKMEFLKNGYRT